MSSCQVPPPPKALRLFLFLPALCLLLASPAHAGGDPLLSGDLDPDQLTRVPLVDNRLHRRHRAPIAVALGEFDGVLYGP